MATAKLSETISNIESEWQAVKESIARDDAGEKVSRIVDSLLNVVSQLQKEMEDTSNLHEDAEWEISALTDINNGQQEKT